MDKTGDIRLEETEKLVSCRVTLLDQRTEIVDAVNAKIGHDAA